MPEQISIENPVELSRDLVLAYRPQRFLRRMCATITHRTASFLIDIQKKTRFLAPYVRDDDDPVVVARDGYETKQFKPVAVSPARNITARDLEKRSIGSNVVEISSESATNETIASNLYLEDMLDLQDSIERREEQQIAEILCTGKVITGVGPDIKAPIPEENIFVNSAAEKFDASGFDPLAWFRKQSSVVARSGGGRAKYAIVGNSALDALLANAKLQKYIDNRRMNFGNVEPTPDKEFEGVTYQGNIGGIEIYTYDELYYDESKKKNTALIPDDRVIIIGNRPRFEMHYAAIFDGGIGTINKTQTYAFTWIEGGKKKWLNLESRPLFVPVNGGNVISAKVL